MWLGWISCSPGMTQSIFNIDRKYVLYMYLLSPLWLLSLPNIASTVVALGFENFSKPNFSLVGIRVRHSQQTAEQNRRRQHIHHGTTP